MIKIPKLNLNKALISTGALALILIVVFWFWWSSKEINISKASDKQELIAQEKSLITGTNCEASETRPVAIMLSSDPVVRPLSGISQADMVFEMPVTPSGVTRFMAVFQCDQPEEVGSIRSAREDFIPLAAGIGAIYFHWGGEREALSKLNDHIIDNIDGLKYENIYFYRKPGLKPPHNGFINSDNISKSINDLKYSKESNFAGYPHSPSKAPANLLNLEETIAVDYTYPFNVKWVYDKESSLYARSRTDKPEIDKNTGGTVKAGVVILMKTTSEFSNKDYLTVHTEGGGEAYIYQKGIKIPARWEKKKDLLDSKLFFYDLEGKEIEFQPGKIWVEIITN